jgi:hypothetical protein
VAFDGTEGVCRAGRVKSAHLAVQRTDDQPVQPKESDQSQPDRIEGDQRGQIVA